MGSFYVNYTVRSADQAAVAKSLKGRSAYVTSARDGKLVVADEVAETQERDAVQEVGELLSKICGPRYWRSSTTMTTCSGTAFSTTAG